MEFHSLSKTQNSVKTLFVCRQSERLIWLWSCAEETAPEARWGVCGGSALPGRGGGVTQETGRSQCGLRLCSNPRLCLPLPQAGSFLSFRGMPGQSSAHKTAGHLSHLETGTVVPVVTGLPDSVSVDSC